MSKWFKSIIQHALTAFGAILVAGGVIDSDQAQQFVDNNVAILTGAAVYGVGQLWSIISKK